MTPPSACRPKIGLPAAVRYFSYLPLQAAEDDDVPLDWDKGGADEASVPSLRPKGGKATRPAAAAGGRNKYEQLVTHAAGWSFCRMPG